MRPSTSATLEAEGRETTGPGSARAKAFMSVTADPAGSLVKIVTDYSVAGRVAQFGRGVMEDVSRRIVNEMAACIKATSRLQSRRRLERLRRPGCIAIGLGRPGHRDDRQAGQRVWAALSVLWARVRSVFSRSA